MIHDQTEPVATAKSYFIVVIIAALKCNTFVGIVISECLWRPAIRRNVLAKVIYY